MLDAYETDSMSVAHHNPHSHHNHHHQHQHHHQHHQPHNHVSHYHHTLNDQQNDQHHQQHAFNDYHHLNHTNTNNNINNNNTTTNMALLNESMKYAGSIVAAPDPGSGSSQIKMETFNQAYDETASAPISSKRGSVQMFGLSFDPAPNICDDRSGINK